MSAGHPPGPGDVLAGYEIESLLGRGGMGTVYLATHARLERKVALKLIAPELAGDEAFRARFLRESQLAAALDHPNVIPVYDAGEADGVLFLAMRYVPGPSLRELLRERGSLALAETQRLAEQIGGALDAAHDAGLVHRDVKPANILLGDPNQHAYLSDFGLAKRTTSHDVTHAGSFLGTVDYSSPEQIQGLLLDGRSDLYSLACVLFECLAGQPPYLRDSEVAVLQAHLNDPPPTVTEVRRELPQTLDDVFARALAKAPSKRYLTGAALVAALAGALEGRAPAAEDRPTRAAPTASVEELPTRPRLRRTPIAALVVLLVAAAAIAVGVILATRGSGWHSAELGTFVDRVENILVQSSAGRQEIADALREGFECSITPGEAAARISSVADNRQSILEQLGTLEAPTDEAARLVTLLQRAQQDSIESDRHYRDAFAIVGKPPPGCIFPANESFRLAMQADARATAAKKQFVAGFDPLAVRYGQRVWSAGDF